MPWLSLMLFIELHALVVFRNMFAKPIETLSEDFDEHGKKVNQPMYQHLSNCSAFNDHIMLFSLPDAASNTTIVSKKLHLHNAVINNVKISDKNDKWVNLNFLKHIMLRCRHVKLISA